MAAARTYSVSANRLAAITTVALIGFGIAQIFLGEFYSRSVVLTANGIDCIGDGFVSGIVWLGLRFIRRPADNRFPFGYYKFENLASMAAAVVMFGLATYIVIRSYQQLIDPQPIQAPILGAAVALMSAVVALALGAYKVKAGRQNTLGSVRLDAINTLKDGTTSTMTVLTLVLVSFGFNFDPYVGFILAGIIYMVGVAAIKQSGLVLLDACDGYCLSQGGLIHDAACSVQGVHSAQIIRLRRTGPVLFAEVEVMVPPEMRITEVERLRKEIKARTKEAVPTLEHITIIAKPLSEVGPTTDLSTGSKDAGAA